MDLHIRQRCEISGKRRGEIAYIGPVEGIPAGDWVGIRLDLAFGKNDGTQGARRYFDCEPLHGVFVRPESVNVSGSFPPYLVVADDVPLEEKVRLVEDALQAQRVNTTQRVKDSKESATLSRADAIEAFWSEFNAKEADIRRALNAMETVTPSVTAELDGLCTKVQQLRDLAGAATLFLPPYDIRATQSLTMRLNQAIEAKRTALAPRKKFQFKARTKLKEAQHPPTDPAQIYVDTSITSSTHTPAENELIYADKTDEVLHITDPGQPDLSLARLSNCIVVIPVETSAVRGHDLRNCTIYTGPIHGSFFLEQCVDCTFVVACRQLRVHHTTNSAFYLCIKSHPIIEDCSTLAFAPYALEYPGLEAQLNDADMQRESKLWSQVHDFKWLRQTQSPNWRVLPDGERQHVVDAKVQGLVSMGE
ncbi:hypothetical protein AC1031_017572 [Aphanomyces cochlioides]|nr:hypothetical protein AC1031_017572 [Aphanomyces cochlioides]